jgi:CheY-like chemotaxis protein
MRKVLFVDDDQVVLGLYRKRLELAGFAVEVASDGLSAMKLANTFRPDVMVLDIMMPKFSGLDVLSYLRGQTAFKALPVIVLSNMFVGGEQRQAAAAGANKVLPKITCTASQLVASIYEVLGEQPPGEPPAPAAETPGTPA